MCKFNFCHSSIIKHLSQLGIIFSVLFFIGVLLPRYIFDFKSKLVCTNCKPSMHLTEGKFYHKVLDSDPKYWFLFNFKNKLYWMVLSLLNRLTVFLGTFDIFHHHFIVRPTEDSVLQKSTFLPGGHLSFAGWAGEAGQVEGAAPHTTHPVAGADVPATASTSGAVSPEANSRNHKLWTFWSAKTNPSHAWSISCQFPGSAKYIPLVVTKNIT